MTLKSFDDGNSTEARQFLLDRRSERKHPKRHRTLKRRLALKAQKRSRMKHRNAMAYKARTKMLLAVLAYWMEPISTMWEDF